MAPTVEHETSKVEARLRWSLTRVVPARLSDCLKGSTNAPTRLSIDACALRRRGYEECAKRVREILGIHARCQGWPSEAGGHPRFCRDSQRGVSDVHCPRCGSRRAEHRRRLAA